MPEDIVTPHIPNSGPSLSNANLNHLFLKLHTPTSGRKIVTTMPILELYYSIRKPRKFFLYIRMHEDHIFYQKQHSMIEVRWALVKRSLDI